MARWSYMLLETTTRRVITPHVPFTDVSFTDGLMDIGGTFQGSFEVGNKFFSEWVSGDQLRRTIVPCRDGIPQGFYILTDLPQVAADTRKQPVHGQRLDWLFAHRAITQTLTFNSVDQNDILRDLLRFGMGQSTTKASPNALDDAAVLAAAQIPWITLDSELSGVTRIRQETQGNQDDGYPATSRKIVAQMVKNLTDLRDASGTRGPEYRWLYRRATDGLPEMVLDTAGPSFRVGKPEDQQPVLSFEFPSGRNGNIKTATYGSDGTVIVTRGHSIGQKQDTTTPVGSATYDDLMALGFPLMDKVVSESTVQDPGVLAAKAAGYLWAADDAWAITLDGNGNPGWGTYSIGDWVLLRVGQGSTPRRRSMRITGWSIKVNDTGTAETITPTLQIGKWYG